MKKLKIFYMCAVLLLICQKQVSSSIFLGCSNETRKATLEDWTNWGRLYSFCTQHNSIFGLASSTPDPECSSDNCQECMTPCKKHKLYDIHSCLSACENINSKACIKGCKFYKLLKNVGGQRNRIDQFNIPVVFGNTTIRQEKSQFHIDYSWPAICPIKSLLPSIYIVLLSVVNKDIPIEKSDTVQFLTTDTNYTLNIDILCSSSFNTIGFGSKKEFNIKIYALNYNGRSKTAIKSSSSSFEENIPSVTNLVIGQPFWRFGQPRLPLTLYWGNGITAATLEGIWKGKGCSELFTNRPNRNSIVFRFSRETRDYLIPNFARDQLTNCTLELRAFAYKSCVVSTNVQTFTYTYKGCSSVKDFPNPCPWWMTTTVSTLPPDGPIQNIKVYISSFNCTKEIITRDSENRSMVICKQGSYSAIAYWDVPFTSSPIQKYEVRFSYNVFTFKNINLLFGTKKRTLPGDTLPPISLPPVDISKIEKLYGFEIRAITSTSSPFKILKKDDGQAIVTFGPKNTARQLNELNYTLDLSSCPETTAIECFKNDSEHPCFECSNGGSYDIVVTWDMIDQGKPYEFNVRWGPSVKTTQGYSFIPSNRELGSALTNSTSYRISGLKRNYLRLGIQVYAFNETSVAPIFVDGGYVFYEAKSGDTVLPPSPPPKSNVTDV